MQNLKDLIKSRGIKQHDLAASLGISDATMSAYAMGIRAIPLRLVAPLADLLGVTVDRIVDVGVPASAAWFRSEFD
jgi:transcriptional regulator with XRE-family HTH domain